ncbi:Ig-like domain-containing protein [Paenarthrobacter sp. NPDC092416]|uniref:Ig-like domain-containing protein n=1 Tax=Paenarthrobacter sp. NPDC092416 TaxID=3364386 RepID=UPI0037FC1E24
MREDVRQRIHAEAVYRVQAYPADMDRALSAGMSTVRRRLLRTWVVAIVAAIALTAAFVVARVLLSEGPATLQSIAVTSPAQSLHPGTTVELSAVGTYSDGARLVLRERVVWASDNQAVAVVTPEGMVTAAGTGAAGLTATLDGVSGRFDLSVTIQGSATLTALKINPSEAAMDPGGKLQLIAEGTYSDGSLGKLNVTALWASSNPGIAAVDGDGMVTATKAGTATISAAESGLQGTSVITVTVPPPAKVTGLSIDPGELTIKQGRTAQLAAIAAYSDGTSKAVTNATWSAGSSKVATVSASGLVTAQTVGQVAIEATHVDSDGKAWKATSKVTVEHVVTSVVVAPAGPHVLDVGQTVQLKATVTYSDGKAGNASVVWASSRPIFAAVSASGLVRGAVQGTAVVTATADGVSSNQVRVTVGPLAPSPGPVG